MFSFHHSATQRRETRAGGEWAREPSLNEVLGHSGKGEWFSGWVLGGSSRHLWKGLQETADVTAPFLEHGKPAEPTGQWDYFLVGRNPEC